MKIIRRFFLFIFLLSFFQITWAQNSRLTTRNKIGWYNYFGTFKISDKFSLHTEYQWRRNNFIKNGQQNLLRVGLNYNFNPSMLFRVGYGWIETYPYGDIPINGLGRSFVEHRIFEMIQLRHKEGLLDLSHRFMLEQRFVGRYSSPDVVKEDEFPLLNRFRYMFRLQFPLTGKVVEYHTTYMAFYDELFIGFGKNVKENIFDQNRMGILLGYQFNKALRLEAGYLHQILQLGREVNSQNVFQNNNGFILNTNFNFDLIKKKPFQ